MRDTAFVSRRAWSLCLFSSRCSAVKFPLGGLEVTDLDPGGVRLTSEAEPIEESSCPRSGPPDELESRATIAVRGGFSEGDSGGLYSVPGHANADRLPIAKVGSN